jgi:hypothetical protein
MRLHEVQFPEAVLVPQIGGVTSVAVFRLLETLT